MLDKFLARHKAYCTHYVFSGDRHCSCGRDAAEAEVAGLRAEVAALRKVAEAAWEIASMESGEEDWAGLATALEELDKVKGR